MYNENDHNAAQWLRNLVTANHIAPGPVIERDICAVQPADVASAVQFHAFAGIGAWSYALRLAGWPDDLPVWTGSCPCQPFSNAGRKRGTGDERHLWPEFHRLIAECRPAIVFGEQVASPAGRTWLDAVSLDLEALGYAVGSADLCAASVGAPHIRQRLYWVAITGGQRRDELAVWARRTRQHLAETDGRVATDKLADATGSGRGWSWGTSDAQFSTAFPRESRRQSATRSRRCPACESRGWHDRAVSGTQAAGERQRQPHWRLLHQPGLAGATSRFWDDADWIPCRDGKARPIEPGTFPLAHGAAARVVRLRAYGNAIVPQVAAGFIGSVIDYLTLEAGA